MAEHTDLASLSIEMIDEYLAAARSLISMQKADGGIYGYSATLLTMAVVDSLGHAQNGPSRGADLSLFKRPEFGDSSAPMQDAATAQLNDWYRNGLVHTGTMAPNVYLLAETTGTAFRFDPEGKLNGIRVPVVLSIVERLWSERKEEYRPARMHPEAEARTPQAYRSVEPMCDSAMSPVSSSAITSGTTPASGAAVTVSGMTSVQGSAPCDARSSETK